PKCNGRREKSRHAQKTNIASQAFYFLKAIVEYLFHISSIGRECCILLQIGLLWLIKDNEMCVVAHISHVCGKRLSKLFSLVQRVIFAAALPQMKHKSHLFRSFREDIMRVECIDESINHFRTCSTIQPLNIVIHFSPLWNSQGFAYK